MNMNFQVTWLKNMKMKLIFPHDTIKKNIIFFSSVEPMETDAAAPNTSPESKEEGQEKSDSSKEVQDKPASSPSRPETKPETKDQATQLFE